MGDRPVLRRGAKVHAVTAYRDGQAGRRSRVPTLRCRVTGILIAVAVLLGATACGVTDSGERLTVFAAASLTDVFRTLGEEFETAHPGVAVTFSFAGSAHLAQQLAAGAPADVVALADTHTMAMVTAHRAILGEPQVFAHNRLVIAVPAGNPRRITGLADLTSVRVALCASQVPCGAAAQTAVRVAGVSLTPASVEPNVRAALTRLVLGEVDAALVYGTDVRGRSDVEAIEFPESAAARNDYSLAVLADTSERALAETFVAFVRSASARAVLTAAGFEASG